MIMKHIFVLDAYNLIYRNFFAVPPMHRRDGQPINAVFGMARMLLQLLREDKPDVMVVAYDAPSETFRSQKYGEYKGTRDRMPDELKSQLPLIEELFRAFGIKTCMIDGYEADDIMGAAAHQYASINWRVSILSGDKDLYQCLNEHVRIVDGMKRLVAGESECVQKFGVGPGYVADYLAIVWDTSDNIPGIKWFGPKKAVDLITRFGHLSDIYDHIWELPEKMQATMMAERDMAFLSLELTQIERDIAIPDFRDLDEYSTSSLLSRRELRDFFQYQEFHSLIRQLPESIWGDWESDTLAYSPLVLEKPLSPKGLYEIQSLDEIPLSEGYAALSDTGMTLEVLLKDTQNLYRITFDHAYPSVLIDWIERHPSQLHLADIKHIYREWYIQSAKHEFVTEAAGLFQ